MIEKYYITTPIYYPSDKLHIGHAYTTVAADALARYKRMCGRDVLFLTGTDEHGKKIADKAQEKGVSPKAYVDEIVAGIKQLWSLMNISYDRFIRTTDDYHILSVQRIFKALYDKGEIYKGNYEGHYCSKPCESFWTQAQLKSGRCPDCGGEVAIASEEAYFFRLSNYGDRLLKHYETNPKFIQPETRKNEMISFINQGLLDLCVSRTSVKWGVPVDFDPEHTVYVWVDALSNYINALGFENDEYEDFLRYWPADLHLVGKEILRFHAIIWPSMLMALGLPLPGQVYGHGWLLFSGTKMSKSLGNVVDPVILCNRYSVDAIRYFLLRDVPFGSDGEFSNEVLIAKINSDLANDLGNLVSRTISMQQKYFAGTLPLERQVGEEDESLIFTALAAPKNIETAMANNNVPEALCAVFEVVGAANRYVDKTAPWGLAKDEQNRPRLAGVMYNLGEALRFIGVLLTPFMPDTASKILSTISVKSDSCLATLKSLESFGALPQNLQVNSISALFPRLDLEKEIEALNALLPKAVQEEAKKPEEKIKKSFTEIPKEEISTDDFMRCHLCCAGVTDCCLVEGADRLLKLTLFDGERQRTVVSGIAKFYSPQDLIGKKVALVANLKPTKLRGILSEGMIMAADNGEEISVLFLDEQVKEGSRIR